MAEKRTFKEFFTSMAFGPEDGITNLPDPHRNDIVEAFELFINKTNMGKGVAAQLDVINAKDNTYMVLTTHNNEFVNLLDKDGLKDNTGYICVNVDGVTLLMISYHECDIQPNVHRPYKGLSASLEPMGLSDVRAFFHELGHMLYHRTMQRSEEPNAYDGKMLSEFDAISFANAALDELAKVDARYADVHREPVSYMLETRMLKPYMPAEVRVAKHENLRSFAGAMILAERGLHEEKEAFLDAAPDAGQAGKDLKRPEYFKQIIRNTDYTTINQGNDVSKDLSWVERTEQSELSAEAEKSPMIR